MRTFIIFLFACCATMGFSQSYSQSWTDVNYAGDGLGYHNLDIYLPAALQESYPVIVYVYGSAFLSNNSKGTDLNTIGSALLDAGYAVVMPNHRASSDAIYPAQINDIKAVIRFVRGTAETYSFDTTFIGISGSSSGGQASMLAGTTSGIEEYTIGSVTMNLEGNLGAYTNESSSVDAVINWFGPVDLLVLDSCGSSMDNQAPDSPASSLVGGAIYDNQDRVAFTNPSTFLDPSDPPTLIIHGDADQVIPICSSEFYYEDLQDLGIVSDFIVTPGGRHGPGTHIESNFQAMVSFFNEAKLAKGNEPRTYVLSVTNGSGTGNYEEGASINIVADDAPAGQLFSEWLGTGREFLSNPTEATTSLLMPSQDINLIAEYTAQTESFQLYAGWNLLGYSSAEPGGIETELAGIWEYVQLIKNMDSFYDASIQPELNSLQEFEFGQGYFIYVSENCSVNW